MHLTFGIDAAVRHPRITELQGEVPLPARFAAGGGLTMIPGGLGALGQADHGDVGGTLAQPLQGHYQAVGIGRKKQRSPPSSSWWERRRFVSWAGLNRLGSSTCPAHPKDAGISCSRNRRRS